MAKRILIVDNDADLLDVVTEILTYEGFEVETAEQTDDIKSLIARCQPDLLIIDFALDGANGGLLCDELKRDPATCGLPVIIFSAYSNKGLTPGIYGCDDFIAKPFDIEVLVASVKKLIGGFILPGADLLKQN